MAGKKRWWVIAALAAASTFGLVGPASANYNDPLRIGLDNNDNCGGGFCASGGTHLSAATAAFPDSALLVKNTANGFGVTGESDSGTGLRALAHGASTALWAENDSTGAGLVAKALWGDGIFASSYSGINKSGVYGESKSGAGYGVVGRTNAGGKAAVWGDNIGGGAGVEGGTTGNFASAVYGHHNGSNPGFGVWGETVNGQGVVGKSTNGNGTEGVTSAVNASGVWAHHEGSLAGYGLYAHSNFGTGVHADGTATGVEGFTQSGLGVHGRAATATGTGVLAQNTYGGFALRASGKSSFSGPATFSSTQSIAGQATLSGGVAVTGKASFSRSGVLTLGSSAGSVVKTGIALTSSSFVLATLQTHITGLTIEAAVPAPGSSSFRIYFNKTAPAGTRVAWFVVN
jgi:hypothetical protein